MFFQLVSMFVRLSVIRITGEVWMNFREIFGTARSWDEKSQFNSEVIWSMIPRILIKRCKKLRQQ